MTFRSDNATDEVEKVRVLVSAELWIDPRDFLSLSERRTVLLGGRNGNWEADFPMRDINIVVKERAPRFILEIFTEELIYALYHSNAPCQGQKSTESFVCSLPLDEKVSREKIYSSADYLFVKERLDGMQKNSAWLNLEEDQTAFHIAIKIGDSCQTKDCGSLDSERNNCQKRSSCFTLSSPTMTANVIDETKFICEETSTEETNTPAADPPHIAPQNISNILPKTCSSNIFSNDSSMLENDVCLPDAHQKATRPVMATMVNSPLSSSDFSMKVKVTDGNTGISETSPLLDHCVHYPMQAMTHLDSFPSAFQNPLEICKNQERHLVETSGSANVESCISTSPLPSAKYILRSLSENLAISNAFNIADMPCDLVSLSLPAKVKSEPCEDNLIDRDSDSSLKTPGSEKPPSKLSSCSFQVNKEINSIFSHIIATGAAPGREKHNVNGPLTDSDTLIFRSMVKDEPSEGNDETSSRKRSMCSFGLPDQNSTLNSLQTAELPRESSNCQNFSPCNVSNFNFNHGTPISSSETDCSADAQMTSGGNNVCMAYQHLVSDSLGSRVLENAKEFKESSIGRISGLSIYGLSSSYSVNTLGVRFVDTVKGMKCDSFDGHLNNLSDNKEIPPKNKDVALPVDYLDVMPLSERIRLLNSTMPPHLKPARKLNRRKKTQEHGINKRDSETCATRRKRRKTATDSVEVALEEDAPGLIQGLLDRGINLGEIKLYGCEEDGDVIDCASDENNFDDFEDVISKIFSMWSNNNSLGKFNLLRPGKGTKAVYCLACLVSLIEQVRYLCFRKCPVEWGWCRDLQSFIFVFEMHNRIVLERPEYGYATYFFELVGTHPIEWQIRRLVIAMKVTSCSRVTLIENRPLLVGEDVSEGEACVLEEYGWRRNSGMGSMLNYCDRVVHDRAQERKSSDWRRKIGKLLMDGYDGGRIVHADSNQQSLDPTSINVKLET